MTSRLTERRLQIRITRQSAPALMELYPALGNTGRERGERLRSMLEKAAKLELGDQQPDEVLNGIQASIAELAELTRTLISRMEGGSGCAQTIPNPNSHTGGQPRTPDPVLQSWVETAQGKDSGVDAAHAAVSAT